MSKCALKDPKPAKIVAKVWSTQKKVVPLHRFCAIADRKTSSLLCCQN